MSLRLPATEAKYQADIKAGRTQSLSEVPSLKEFEYWRIIPNKYPHDRIYRIHNMLVPKRVFPSLMNATKPERREYFQLLTSELINDYDCAVMNFPSQQSITNHFHTHLGVVKSN